MVHHSYGISYWFIPSNPWYVARIFQISNRQLVMKNELGDWSHSETAKYFEWIIITYINCKKEVHSREAVQHSKKIIITYKSLYPGSTFKIIDLIAIPDFAAGAMENWGLITYRLTSLLYDKHKSSDSNKQWVAVVVAHELAHQVCKLLKKSVCESVRKSTEKFGDCLGLCLSSGAGFFSLFCFIIFSFALA